MGITTGVAGGAIRDVLSGEIPCDERIVTIEDAAELQLQQPHVVRLETAKAEEQALHPAWPTKSVAMRSCGLHAWRPRAPKCRP